MEQILIQKKLAQPTLAVGQPVMEITKPCGVGKQKSGGEIAACKW